MPQYRSKSDPATHVLATQIPPLVEFESRIHAIVSNLELIQPLRGWAKGESGFLVPTANGKNELASAGDWIVKDIDGNLTVWGDTVFPRHYEVA